VYGYTGEYSGDYNELLYLRARFYAPGMGRFLTKDAWEGDTDRPITYNKWAYANANPILYVDPSGHISIHMQVIARYAFRDNLMPEYIIPSTIPNSPPLWPGQRRGKRVDLADLVNFQIWEVEEYSPSGNYPKGHGPSQVDKYLGLLKIDTDKWMPGRLLRPLDFTSGAYDVSAWSEAPGLIVYKAKVNKTRALVLTTLLCLSTYERMIEALQRSLRELPRYLPPIPAPNPAYPPVIVPPPLPVPVFIIP
jgi:RHS repeat-associated protein